METYFNIRYLFDKQKVWHEIDNIISSKDKGYICVCDGVILTHANTNADYLNVINSSLFSICDSGYIPVYLRVIHKIKRSQYSGSEIFSDAIAMQKYKMCFLGGESSVLDSMKEKLGEQDEKIKDMYFEALPFCDVNEFDYTKIAQRIKESGAQIIWIALGAPKQEIFMNKLLPYLDSGVMIAVGAVFNFVSGSAIKRAPKWMIKSKLEFAYRIFSEPKKQIARCKKIISTLPKIINEERKKKCNKQQTQHKI